MKPSKMRNRQIWRASHSVRSRQLGAALSPDLRSRHSRRSVRVVAGDTVRVVRGEYKDVEGRVSRVFALAGRIAIEGVKKEKGKGEKFDVQIHSTNVVVTSLNGADSRRMARIRGERGAGRPAPPPGGAQAPAPRYASTIDARLAGRMLDGGPGPASTGPGGAPKGAGEKAGAGEHRGAGEKAGAGEHRGAGEKAEAGEHRGAGEKAEGHKDEASEKAGAGERKGAGEKAEGHKDEAGTGAKKAGEGSQ